VAEAEVGIALGLAWTEVGGEILPVETTLMSGKGTLTLTGKLGEVMQESAKTALSYVRAHAKELGIDPDFLPTTDIHIHVPEGAIPKDGPSAGITMATSLASALGKIPVRQDLAMTGEMTLRGRVLRIGGLKEKVLAAHRRNLRTIIIPRENEDELEEIAADIRRQLTFLPVETLDEVFAAALQRPRETRARVTRRTRGSSSRVRGTA
jgi:ATP-dependent Lon protease